MKDAQRGTFLPSASPCSASTLHEGESPTRPRLRRGHSPLKEREVHPKRCDRSANSALTAWTSPPSGLAGEARWFQA